jgi:hypothetical protein
VGRSIFSNVEEREPLSVTMIEGEANVVVEYIVYGNGRWGLSIGLMQEVNVGIDFASPKKKEKTSTSYK